jgi:hypothetical protein
MRPTKGLSARWPPERVYHAAHRSVTTPPIVGGPGVGTAPGDLGRPGVGGPTGRHVARTFPAPRQIMTGAPAMGGESCSASRPTREKRRSSLLEGDEAERSLGRARAARLRVRLRPTGPAVYGARPRAKLPWLGIQRSPSTIVEPQWNSDRTLMQTLKEQGLWLDRFTDLVYRAVRTSRSLRSGPGGPGCHLAGNDDGRGSGC